MNIGIIGYGYWGPNLVRNFNLISGCLVKKICDMNKDRLKLAKRSYPNVECTTNSWDLICDKNIDAVVIATPVSTHFELAKEAIANGKHVLLEKPMATSLEECKLLIRLAEAANVLLMVDHTFLYTGAVRMMKKLITSGDIGNVKYFDSTRINLGLFQSDVNVLWDLAPHDISILIHLFEKKPKSVNATGASHTKNNIQNIAFLTINYDDNVIAHINCSWTSPVKIRSILIGGDRKMLQLNDLEPTDKLRIYDSGYQVRTGEDRNQMLVDYRTGDIIIPKIDLTEALALMANDFVNSINNRTKPISNSHLGLEVTRILQAAEKSLHNNGKEISLCTN